MYVTVYDIVHRLLRRRRYTYYEVQDVIITTLNQRFNLLTFKFPDDDVTYRIYNKQQDIDKLAHEAISHLINLTYSMLPEFRE